jgi:hypothetical protein
MRITKVQPWAKERAALNRARKLVAKLSKMERSSRMQWFISPEAPQVAEVVKAFSLVYPDPKEADAKLTEVLS